jgi:hypothetical protein
MARKTYAPTAGTRVHYDGYADDRGTVEETRQEEKFGKGGGGWNTGTSYGATVTVTMYGVRWDAKSKELDWHQISELRPV